MDITLDKQLLVGSDIDPRWSSGPFTGIKLMPAKAKGKRFEQIAESILVKRQHLVEKPINSDHDRIVDGYKFEIKGSTITKDTDDVFSFLQIRPAQDYDFLILETFWFDGTIKFFKLDKATVSSMVEKRIFKPQHGGNSGNSGTFCYNGNLTPFAQYFWFEVKIQ